MRYLGLDIGDRRTGVAFLDTTVSIPLPLDTVRHASEAELVTAIMTLIEERSIDCVVVGLPKLPSGDEGEQAAHSRAVGAVLQSKGISVEYVDERHTTPRSSTHKNAIPSQNVDGDAAAACAILSGKV